MKVLRIIIIAFIAITVGSFIYFTAGTNPETLLFERIENLEQHHFYLILLLIALTLLSTITGLPVFYFGIALGFLLPLLPALIIGWNISLLSVMATFYMVKFAFYRYFKDKYGGKKIVKKINKRVSKNGLWAVVFSRSVYVVPTSIINFTFPISKISTKQYFFGTMIGLIPETLINVITGYLVKHEIILLSSPEAGNWKTLVIAGFLLLLTILFIILRGRQKRKDNPLRVS